MHLRGTAPAALTTNAQIVTSLATEPLELGEHRLTHFTFESPMNTETLPPAVHPSIPNHISILCWDLLDSPFGKARVVQVRLGCIVGIFPRGLVTGCFTDNPALRESLTSYGMSAEIASIETSDTEEAARISVSLDGASILDVKALDQTPVVGAAATVHSSLCLAKVAGEVRLAQVDFRSELDNPTRGLPRIDVFDHAALGAQGADPRWPISAVAATGTLTVRPIRYTLDPSGTGVALEESHSKN